MRVSFSIVGLVLTLSACKSIPVAQMNTSMAPNLKFSPQRLAVASQFSDGFAPAFMLSMERRLGDELRSCEVEAQFIHRQISFSGMEYPSEATAAPHAPRFTVKDNEVLYVGNVVQDYRNRGKLTTSIKVDEQHAKDHAGPTGLDQRLVTRSWERPTGPSDFAQ